MFKIIHTNQKYNSANKLPRINFLVQKLKIDLCFFLKQIIILPQGISLILNKF